jgi:enoyl-CoA hydratase/carnithine racemase
MTDRDLLYEVKDRVARITIDREAQRNAITGETVRLFHEYLDRAQNDPQVRVVLVTGSGEQTFCSGADLGSGPAAGGGDTDPFQSYADLLKRLTRFPKPTVARVNGSCVAGGTGFALACDIVIASDRARFGTPEVNVGLFPMMIGALIFRNVGRKRAMEMVLLGEKIDAEQALQMGLVTRLVPPDDLDREVDRVVEALAGKSPIGMKIGKEAFYDMEDMPFGEALDFLAGKLKEVAGTEDAAEGITAFIEKRKPDFRGR